MNNICGESAQTTCTGNYGVGPCCSMGGYCGSSAEHCGAEGIGAQPEFSHSNRLCPSPLEKEASPCKLSLLDSYWARTEEPQCFTIQEVANTWHAGVALAENSDAGRTDATAMCVPAVAVAVSAAYDVSERCPKSFDLMVRGESEGARPVTLRGMWQIGEGYEARPVKQALAVYLNYTSAQTCLSELCVRDRLGGCGDVIPGIKQDQTTASTHRFCKGVWPQVSASLAIRLQQIGGLDAVQKACDAAATGRGCDADFAIAHGALAKVKKLAADREADAQRRGLEGKVYTGFGDEEAVRSSGPGDMGDEGVRDATAAAAPKQGLLPEQDPMKEIRWLNEQKEGAKAAAKEKARDGCSPGCTDLEPPSRGHWENPTCALQRANGKCAERRAMKDGYCELTCGICNACA